MTSTILHSVFGTTTPHEPSTIWSNGCKRPIGEVSDISHPVGQKRDQHLSASQKNHQHQFQTFFDNDIRSFFLQPLKQSWSSWSSSCQDMVNALKGLSRNSIMICTKGQEWRCQVQKGWFELFQSIDEGLWFKFGQHYQLSATLYGRRHCDIQGIDVVQRQDT
jgi:hypothetical protein